VRLPLDLDGARGSRQDSLVVPVDRLLVQPLEQRMDDVRAAMDAAARQMAAAFPAKR